MFTKLKDLNCEKTKKKYYKFKNSNGDKTKKIKWWNTEEEENSNSKENDNEERKLFKLYLNQWTKNKLDKTEIVTKLK